MCKKKRKKEEVVLKHGVWTCGKRNRREWKLPPHPYALKFKRESLLFLATEVYSTNGGQVYEKKRTGVWRFVKGR